MAALAVPATCPLSKLNHLWWHRPGLGQRGYGCPQNEISRPPRALSSMRDSARATHDASPRMRPLLPRVVPMCGCRAPGARPCEHRPVTDDPVGPESREALAAQLEALGVREGTYHLLGAHLEDAMVMDKRDEGWVVFYSERGSEHSLKVHGDEASACGDLLARVCSEDHVFFDLVAGPAPAAEAEAAFDGWLKQRGVTRASLAATDCKSDDVPWVPGAYWRRYFVRITAIRRLDTTS